MPMTGRLASIRRAACFVVLSATLAAAQSAPRPAPPPDLDQWVSQGYGVRKLGDQPATSSRSADATDNVLYALAPRHVRRALA
jgi:hypothetical protein